MKLLTASSVKYIDPEELLPYSVIYSLPSYLIYQHPKTFEHILIRCIKKGRPPIIKYIDCGRWVAKGGMSDPSVNLPGGFIAELIEEYRVRPNRVLQSDQREEPITYLRAPRRWASLNQQTNQYGQGTIVGTPWPHTLIQSPLTEPPPSAPAAITTTEMLAELQTEAVQAEEEEDRIYNDLLSDDRD